MKMLKNSLADHVKLKEDHVGSTELTSLMLPPPSSSSSSSSLSSSTAGMTSHKEGRHDIVYQREATKEQMKDREQTIKKASMKGHHSERHTLPSTSSTATTTIAASGRWTMLRIHLLQKGNPMVKHITALSGKEYVSDLPADFQVGQKAFVLFLSLRYHNLHKEYIRTRLRGLGQWYSGAVRILLVLVDVADNDQALRDLTMMTIQFRTTILLAWSNEEAATYIESLTLCDGKNAAALQTAKSGTHRDMVSSAVKSMKSISTTNAFNLMNSYSSLRDIATTSLEQLQLVPGFGPTKALSLWNVFNEPFVAHTEVLSSNRENRDNSDIIYANEETIASTQTNLPSSIDGAIGLTEISDWSDEECDGDEDNLFDDGWKIHE